MAKDLQNPVEEVVIGEERGHVRLITLNRPRQLNVISSKVVSLLAQFLEKWEKDDDAELVIIKGAGRAFCAGGDLTMFYAGRTSKDACLEVVYRMYWLCFHIHSYKKTQVALVNGISMGGGASFMVPMTFSVVTEKVVFATPETSIGFHTECGFSYMLSHLPGRLGEYLALTGARLNGKELVAIGFATHFVPSEKINELEQHLLRINSGDEQAVKAGIEDFSVNVQLDDDSILNKQSIIDECFSKISVEEIIKSLETESSKEGNAWINSVLAGLKKSSPLALKITLKSIREGRNQTLSESLRKEFRVTMNILRTAVSGDMYEGIRALAIDKDNAPKWDPPSLDKVDDEKVDSVFQPFQEELELAIPEMEDCRNDTGGRMKTVLLFLICFGENVQIEPKTICQKSEQKPCRMLAMNFQVKGICTCISITHGGVALIFGLRCVLSGQSLSLCTKVVLPQEIDVEVLRRPKESQSQGTINWLDVYVATREGIPAAQEVAKNYRTLVAERYPEGTQPPHIDQELWERASIVKKNYVKGQGQRRRPSIFGSTCSTQSSQSQSHPLVHTPADCVRAICQDRALLRVLGGHLGLMDPDELARAVAEAAASQQSDGQQGDHDDQDADDYDEDADIGGS